MGKLVLYGVDHSPPVRACLMTLKALNLSYNYKIINLMNGEHLTPEYRLKNPQHTVPTLSDDSQIIWDSHAIMAYLVRKYGKENDPLYPTDFIKRAIIEQRLYFDAGVVFQGGIRNITAQLLLDKDPCIPLNKIMNIKRIYNFLEIFLKNSLYMAGAELTIADFSLIASVTSLVAFLEIDPNAYPNLIRWIEQMKLLSYYQEANGKGAKEFVHFMRSLNFIIKNTKENSNN